MAVIGMHQLPRIYQKLIYFFFFSYQIPLISLRCLFGPLWGHSMAKTALTIWLGQPGHLFNLGGHLDLHRMFPDTYFG